jgi:EmrB/QacA subfamily drug resistance transporter
VVGGARAAPGGCDLGRGVRPETRLGLALSLGGLVVVLDTTMTVVAAPALALTFDVPLSTIQWTTTAYLLALMATLPLAAWLADRFGPRRTYVAALLIFSAGTVATAVAPGLAALIAARALQGLGGGLVNPLAMTLALRGVPPERRGRVTSLLGLPVLIGPLLGPVVGGALLDSVSWRVVFLIVLPPALLGAWVVGRLAPADPPPTSRRVDLAGVGLLIPGTVALLYAVSAADGDPRLRLGLAIAGAAASAGFVVRSLRHPAPLLRLRLLGHRLLRNGLLVLVPFGAAYFGSMSLNPTYVQVTRDDPAAIAGLLAIPTGLAAGLMLQVATRLVDRFPAGAIVGTGLVMALAGQAATALVLDTATPYVLLGGLGALLGFGAGCVLMPTITAATRHLDGPDLANGSTLATLAQQFASAAGTAAMTGLFTALAPLDAPAAELVAAQRLTLLLPIGLTAAALVVALIGLGATQAQPSRLLATSHTDHLPGTPTAIGAPAPPAVCRRKQLGS